MFWMHTIFRTERRDNACVVSTSPNSGAAKNPAETLHLFTVKTIAYEL